MHDNKDVNCYNVPIDKHCFMQETIRINGLLQYAQFVIGKLTSYIFMLCIFTALCESGTYSESGLEPCKNCPALHYQLNSGSTKCQPCSDDMTAIDSCMPSSTMDAKVNFEKIVLFNFTIFH